MEAGLGAWDVDVNEVNAAGGMERGGGRERLRESLEPPLRWTGLRLSSGPWGGAPVRGKARLVLRAELQDTDVHVRLRRPTGGRRLVNASAQEVRLAVARLRLRRRGPTDGAA